MKKKREIFTKFQKQESILEDQKKMIAVYSKEIEQLRTEKSRLEKEDKLKNEYIHQKKQEEERIKDDIERSKIEQIKDKEENSNIKKQLEEYRKREEEIKKKRRKIQKV